MFFAKVFFKLKNYAEMKNVFRLLATVLIVLTTVSFSGCEKQDESLIDILKKSNDASNCIAYYDEKEQQVVLDFDADKFRSELEFLIKEEIGRSVVVEKVQVEDKNPTKIDYVGNFVFSYFDIDKEETYTHAISLSKDFDNDGSVVYYVSGKTVTTVTCISHPGCRMGECVIMYNSHGEAQDCTPCEAGCQKIISSKTTDEGDGVSMDGLLKILLKILKDIL